MIQVNALTKRFGDFTALNALDCTIPSGYPQALEHNALEWIHPSQTQLYEFCPADTDIIAEIKRRYEKRKPL